MGRPERYGWGNKVKSKGNKVKAAALLGCSGFYNVGRIVKMIVRQNNTGCFSKTTFIVFVVIIKTEMK
jgi:hypothetical protein